MRNHWKILLICSSALAILIMFGCGSDSATDPGTDPGDETPPTYELLDLSELILPDLSFFDDAVAKEGQVPSHFAEARALVMTEQHKMRTSIERAISVWEAAEAVTPTIVDGIPRWEYPYTDTQGTVDIKIIIRELETHTEWTLSVTDTSADPQLLDEWWVYILINKDGVEHSFGVNQLDDDDPIRDIGGSWGTREGRSFINFRLSHFGGRNDGDATYFDIEGPYAELRNVNRDLDRTWKVLWNETENMGGLTHPDYNDGYEACWDSEFVDTRCF